MGTSKLKNTAAPQVAGYILQLERALFHLGTAAANVAVAVEFVDDVATTRNGRILLQEQDKNSVKPNKQLLGDRSKALWHTLRIWLEQRRDTDSAQCQHYLIVTSTAVDTSIASMLKDVSTGNCKPTTVIQALRAEGNKRSKSEIQGIINEVLEYGDKELEQLISRIEIVDLFDAHQSRTDIANGLAIDPRADAEVIIDNLLGWLTRTLREFWQTGRPGLISREACVRQCREVENLQGRQRFLPRPARDVPVEATDRATALARPFVEHLSRIRAEDDDVFQAVEHFVQFNVEKHRLAAEGEVADREWRDRSDRLRQRWKNIVKSIELENAGRSSYELGKRILAESTYQHLEPLGGQLCGELYMTSGHYHRLADDDEVWWDPTYQSSVSR